jgi:hypothetical protein
MRRKYEAWADYDNLAFADANNIKEQKQRGLISKSATLLHVIEADTWEEACAVHHIKSGFEPYKPEGKSAKCPNNCGSIYYPNGSAECPKCGIVE